MDWEAVWEDLDNDANGEWPPKTYRALTTQKFIQGSRKGGIGILPLSLSIDFYVFGGIGSSTGYSIVGSDGFSTGVSTVGGGSSSTGVSTVGGVPSRLAVEDKAKFFEDRGARW